MSSPIFSAVPRALRSLLLLACLLAAIAGAVPLPPRDLEGLDDKWLEAYMTHTALAEALALIEGGDVEAAAVKARAFLDDHPDSAPAHEIVGIVEVLEGNIEAGMRHLKHAVKLEPGRSTAITKVGDIYLARGEVARARAQFMQAVAVNPLDRHAHQRLGLILENQGLSERAIEHFEKGIPGTPPGYIGIKVNLGRLYNRSRRFTDTVALLETTVAEDSDNRMAHLVLGAAYSGLDKRERALACFKRASGLEGTDKQARLALGIAYRDAGKFEQSLEELRHALEMEPGWDLARLQEAETLAAMGRLDEAIEAFSAVASKSENPAPVHKRMAAILARGGRADEAAAIYQQLRNDGTADVDAYLGLATLLQVSNQLGEAEKVLQEAAGRFPDESRTHFALGMHHALVLDYDRAQLPLKKAHALSPADPRTLKAMSMVAVRRGMIGEAISHAESLIDIVPDQPDERFHLASLLEADGKPAEAIEHYTIILTAAPEHVPTLNNLANTRLRQGKQAEALDLALRAARLQSENGTILDTLGWIQCKCGKLDDARKTLESAIAKGPASATHRYHLAVVCSKLGDNETAEEQLALALADASGFPERKDAEKLAASIAR